MKAFLAIIVACVLLVAFYDYSRNGTVSLLGFHAQNEAPKAQPVPYGQVAASLAAMIAGILFGSIYERVREIQGRIRILAELRGALCSAQFYKAILVAPLVFMGVYTAARTQPDQVVALLFAFQNGFFCHNVFLAKKRNLSAP